MRRRVGVVALLVGAALAVLGTVLPLYTHAFDLGRDLTFENRQNLWGLLSGERVQARDAWFGLPVVAGAGLAVLGAVLARRAWGRLAALAGVMLMIGAVWAVAQQVLVVATVDPISGVTVTTDLESGAPVLVGGLLAALAGALLVQDWTSGDAPAETGDGEVAVVHRLDDPDAGPDADADTPPFGIAIPVSELDVPPATPRAGDAGPAGDGRRHPSGGNPSTVD
ncbi:hypothetical protein [Saccharothrix hoggarensis]